MNDATKTALRAWFDTHIVGSDEFDVEYYKGYGGYDYNSEVLNLAAAMYGGYDTTEAPLPEITHMVFAAECDGDGVIDGYSMRIAVERRGRLLGWSRYLSTYLSWKDTTDDREATGAEAAWATVVALADTWLGLYEDVTRIRTALEA